MFFTAYQSTVFRLHCGLCHRILLYLDATFSLMLTLDGIYLEIAYITQHTLFHG